MDSADKLREASTSAHVALAKFFASNKKTPDVLFCFFEGKDDEKYYGFRIESITQRAYKGFSCGNKKEVIRVEKLISSKKGYESYDKLYFIDKDFSENCTFKNIYCLPSYSIENEYCRVESLKEILKNEFSLNDAHEDFDKVIKYFKKLRDKFHSHILLINAWLSCQQKIREETGKSTRLNIDDTIGKKYFKNPVDTNLRIILCFSDLNSKEKIEAIFNKAPKVDAEILAKEVEKFEKSDCCSTFRGKFELHFFICFLSRIQAEMGKKPPKLFKDKHKCSLRFEYCTALTQLNTYAITPDCLPQYLKSKRQKH